MRLDLIVLFRRIINQLLIFNVHNNPLHASNRNSNISLNQPIIYHYKIFMMMSPSFHSQPRQTQHLNSPQLLLSRLIDVVVFQYDKFFNLLTNQTFFIQEKESVIESSFVFSYFA